MKRIHSTVFLLTAFVFSCQHKNTEQTATDSLTINPAAVANSDTLLEMDEASMTSDEGAVELSPEDFDYTYEGLVNNKYKVRVNMFQIRGEKMARLVYMNSKKIINMDFAYPAVGMFELTEKIGDKVTGIWRVEVEEEDILSGTWNSADGAKQLPVQLGMSGGDFDDFLPKEEIKTGSYELRKLNEDAESKEEFSLLSSEELYVKNMAGNTIYFDLYIQGPPPGVHIGMANGIAHKAGNDYIYTNEEGCEITLSFSGDEVALNQKGSDVNCGFGANIYAYGTLNKKSN